MLQYLLGKNKVKSKKKSALYHYSRSNISQKESKLNALTYFFRGKKQSKNKIRDESKVKVLSGVPPSRSLIIFNPSDPFFSQKNFKETINQLSKSIFESLEVVTYWQLITKVCIYFTLFSLCASVIYLSHFDTFLLINQWQVNFLNKGNLSQQDLNKLSNAFHNKRFLQIFPNDSLFFVTSDSLTIEAKNTIPEIEKVEIIQKKYPNSIDLEITMSQPLATIAVNIDGVVEFWNVNQQGKITTINNSNYYNHLIYIDSYISFDLPNTLLTDVQPLIHTEQLNRIYFTLFLKKKLADYNINYTRIAFPSLNIQDNNVIIELLNGTKLYFSLDSLSRNGLEERLESIFAGNLREKILSGKLKYLDLRIAKKLLSCCE
jgi:hypothetical protein